MAFEQVTARTPSDFKSSMAILAIEGDTSKYLAGGAQFNPSVDYENVNKAHLADSSRESYFVDKALAVCNLAPECVAGKVVSVDVGRERDSGEVDLSEMYSGTWLIEQSIHSWSRLSKQATTKMVLVRSNFVPRSKSLLKTSSYK
jgi:hypothetical protein